MVKTKFKVIAVKNGKKVSETLKSQDQKNRMIALFERNNYEILVGKN
jgi:translation elongation factor P/translation initiation factor 5A